MKKPQPILGDRASWQAYRKTWETGSVRQGIRGPKIKKWDLFYHLVGIVYGILKKDFHPRPSAKKMPATQS